MAKSRKRKMAKSKLFNFRCHPEEIEEFHKAAQREGFDSVSAWLLWHLRRIIRDSNDKRS